MDFEVRRGTVADVDRLEPLWHALQDHHATLPSVQPVRTPAAAWERRRGQYLEWLAKDESTLLLADRGGEPIGYAVVSISEQGSATWEIGEQAAEIETLSVLESERGGGVGRALMDAAMEVAEAAGAGATFVAVAHTNADAIRFYEREGFDPFYVLMIRRSPT